MGAGAGVTFQQPDSASITLNRVTGTEASVVNGSLLANGQVWMINRNGILFGQGSHIDVGGLIATTSDMKDGDFLSGHYAFAIPSANPDAAVVNQGSIKAATGGAVLLSAGRVRNEGLIQARLGHVVLGGADAFSVAFDGDNLLQYQISAPVSQPPKNAQGASALVSNSGVISAQGGNVLLTARAARGVVDNVINSAGLIQANSASIQNGEVVLDAGEDGHVAVSGTIDVSGPNAGESGGTIAIRGNSVAVADGARLEASGDAGGGTVLIGGNLHDGGADPVAQSVAIGKSVIAANGTGSGKGGTVTIASNGLTGIAASISAKGVAVGGMVETSGHELTVTSDAHVDTSASAGAGGMWLIDPVNVDVDPALASNIVGNLANTNVSISASNDINVNAPLVYATAHSLSFLAGHNLTFNADVQNIHDPGAIFAIAGWDGSTAAANILSTPGSYGRGGGSVLIGGNGAGAGVAVGSRFGTTIVAASDLGLSAVNGYAQLGFHGSSLGSVDTGGGITVALTGGLSLTGGASSGSFAQIGHGGIGAARDELGNIAVNVQGSVALAGGPAAQAYALIGDGGAGSTGRNGGTVRLISSGTVALGAGASVKAAGPGDALVIAAATSFINQAGNAALDVSGGGRWLVFLHDPGANAAGGLSAAPFYNRAYNFPADSYAPVTGAANRFVYVIAPQLTVTATSQTKVYGNSNPVLTASIVGGLPGDLPTGVMTGSPSLGTIAGNTTRSGDYSIVAGQGTLFSDFNYGFQFVNGILHIDPATLTASLVGTVQKVFDGTTSAVLIPANYQLSGVVPGDSVTLNSPANGNYADKNAGSAKIVSVGGLTLLGLDSGNYLLSSANASGAIGTITPAMLVGASPVGTVQKVFDGTTLAVLIPANYQLSGVVPGDSVTLNSPANGNYADKNAGSAKIVSVGGLTLLGLDSGNYLLSSANASGAIGTITPATVGASLVGTVQKVFDGTTSAVLIPANYQLSGVVPGDSVTLNSPANGNYANKNVGSAKIVSVGGLTLLGLDSGNYLLSSANASGAIGTITPATVGASLVGTVQKVFDGTTSAVLIRGQLSAVGRCARRQRDTEQPGKRQLRRQECGKCQNRQRRWIDAFGVR